MTEAAGRANIGGMSDTLTWSIVVGFFSAIGTAIIGGLFAFRTSRMNTEQAAERLNFEKGTASVAEWKAIAEHYEKRAEKAEADGEKLRRDNEALARELAAARAGANPFNSPAQAQAAQGGARRYVDLDEPDADAVRINAR